MNADDAVGTRMGQIIDEAVRLARAAWKTVLLYVAVLGVVGVASDQMEEVSAANLAMSVLNLGLGYALTVQLLRDGGLVKGAMGAGFGSYFGLAILSSLGIALGVVLLVIPGLVLFVRWSPAYGFLLGEGAGVTDAMSTAWEKTGPHFWPIALAMLVPVVINLAAGAVYAIGSDEAGLVNLPLSIIANGAISCAGAAITAIGIAAYSLLHDRSAQMAEIFA